MSQSAMTLLILGLVVIGFVTARIPAGLVALGAALLLLGTGIIDLPQAFAGFSDPAVVLIAALFVVAEGLDASGLTSWTGQLLVRRGGTNPKVLTALIMITVAVLTALISVNGAVAALLPVVVVVATRIGTRPSKLLLPLAFGAHAGSLLTLTGSPVNVIISELADESGNGPFSFFSFAVAGVPIVIGTVLIATFGRRFLIPDRVPASMTRDLSDHARTLLRQYALTRELARFRVNASSPLIGKQRTEVDLGGEVTLVAVHTPAGRPRTTSLIKRGDQVLLRGETDDAIQAAQRAAGLRELAAGTDGEQDSPLIDATFGSAEIVVPPRSEMIGQQVFSGMVTDSGDLVILDVKRAGETLSSGSTTLRAGDTVLLQGRWEALDTHLDDPSVLVVDAPDQLRRQAAPLGARGWTALAILALMVLALALDVMPPAVTGLLAAAAMVITRVVTVERAHRSISWTTLLLVAGMLPMSTAITQTGTASMIANGVVSAIGHHPTLLLLALCVIAMIFGQLISNTATVLIIAPIALSVATDMGVSPLPFLMALAVVCAAAFLTPVATPANFMIMGPAGLRFGDYWKLGLPLMVLFLVVGVFLVPLVWPF